MLKYVKRKKNFILVLSIVTRDVCQIHITMLYLQPRDSISDSDIKLFCKYIFYAIRFVSEFRHFCLDGNLHLLVCDKQVLVNYIDTLPLISGKNSAFLRLVRCRSIEKEFNAATAKTADIGKVVITLLNIH